jgi:hypothetical protein
VGHPKKPEPDAGWKPFETQDRPALRKGAKGLRPPDALEMRRLRAGVGTPEVQFGRNIRRDTSLRMDVAKAKKVQDRKSLRGIPRSRWTL